MNKWIKGLGIIGSENEGTKHRQEPTRRNMPRGNNKVGNNFPCFPNSFMMIIP